MSTIKERRGRLVRVGEAKRLTRGFGATYLEINMGRQDEPA